MTGAAVLAVMCGSAFAVWLNGGQLPLGLPPLTGNQASDDYGVGAAAQPGPSASPSRTPGSSPTSGDVPVQVSASGVPAKASYKTVALLGLGGFDTEVTVSDSPHGAWTVVLTMPDATAVENRSKDLVKVEQNGTVVTITPLKATTPVKFTIRFPAVLALGKSAKDCKIDGTPCVAG